MKIALSGYYGFDNAGDEALLLAITSSIKQTAPEARFVVFSGNPVRTTSAHGHEAVFYKNPFQVVSQLLRCDLLISGGGSIFQDVTSARSLWYYISIVALAKALGKPVMFYAQGVGPINLKFSQLLMRAVGNHADMISVRDQESAQLLKSLGVTKPPMLITADPVFSLHAQQEDLAAATAILRLAGLGAQPCIGISVRHWQALEGYQPILARALDALAVLGYDIVFIPLSWPEDVPESKKVQALMTTTSTVLEQRLNTGVLLALIGRMDIIISMRLHALIFAATQGTLFAGISYDPKVESFLHLFDLAPLPLEAEQIVINLTSLLNDQEQKQRINRTAAELRSRAEENTRLALGLVEQHRRIRA